MKSKIPNTIIAAVILITINLWIASKSDFGSLLQQPLRSLSQILALVGIVLMSLTLLFTTRIKLIEKVFGGLDTVYFIHQILGAISFVFLMNHPLLLVIQSLPNISSAILYLIPGSDLTYNLGIIGLYAMILSFIFMVFIKLPYHIWKYLHKLLGITFLLGSLHAFLVPSDISSYFPLRLWIASFIVIGFISSVYTIFFYRSFGPKFLYEITKIERVLDVMNIYFRPVTKKILAFTSGQFVYLEFSNPVLGSETHPYSISSAPQESELRISAKILGDYTLRLPNLKEGNRAFIYGPYGTFGQIPKSEKAIWIAGGIGVTPFLSQLHSEIYQQRYKSISFYYAYRTSEEGIYDGEIREIANRIPYCRYVKWCSNERKRLTADAINQETPIDSVDAIFCCGPPPMMEGLKKQFLQLGLPEDKFHFENFSFLP